jgi:hypothetical protein
LAYKADGKTVKHARSTTIEWKEKYDPNSIVVEYIESRLIATFFWQT